MMNEIATTVTNGLGSAMMSPSNGTTPPPVTPTADTGQVPFADAANKIVPTTLTADQIAGSTGPVHTPVATPQASNPLGDLLTSLKANSDAALKAKTDATSNINTTQSDIQLLSGILSGENNTSSSLATDAGIPQMSTDLRNLHNTQSFQTAAYLNAVNAASTGPGGTKGYMNNQINNIDRQHGLDALTTSALIDAKNNDITTAQAKVDKAVGMQYDPIKAQLTAKLQVLQNNYNMLSEADQNVADARAAQLQTQLKQIDINQSNTKDAISTAMTQVTNGMLDGATVSKAASDLMSGKTDLAGFYSALGIASGSGSGSSSGGDGAAVIQNTMKMMGAASDMPLTQAIQTLGIDKVVAGLINQEGGSPNGVVNNPGNIKFVGQAGATNSGVQATDGGTFASFPTPEAGAKAVASLVQAAANKGANLSDFIASYKGVKNTSSPSYAQYGLLANTDFNPNNQNDKTALAYLTSYLKNATLPSPTALGISTKAGVGKTQFANATARANDLYFNATGQSLPDVNILKTNKGLISNNNKLLNNLDVQNSTVAKNFALALQNIDSAKLNQNSQPINAFLDNIKNLMGDPATATYISQNATLQNEVGSLLAIKNASGTTVHDKLESAGLIPKNASEAQQKQILQTILQEAENGKQAIQDVNSDLYSQIDPLQLDPSNPNRDIVSNSSPGQVGTDVATTLRSKYGY